MTETKESGAQNIDRDEVEKFNQLAHKWWDPESEFKPLHDLNPVRMEYIAEKVALDGLNVLDVGCGGGILSEALARSGARVTGIDKAGMPLEIARQHAKESQVEVDYRDITVEELAASEPQRFDLITCMEMLEHVPDPDSVIRSCATLLKPGGHLFLSTISRNPKAWLFAIVGAEYILKLLPKGTHDYNKLIKPSELAASLRTHRFHLGDVSGMSYNPFSGKYSISRDTDVNYLVYARLENN